MTFSICLVCGNKSNGVIFNIEEMAVTTGLFETMTKWRAMGDCNRGFLATQMGAATALSYPTAYGSTPGSNQYGAPTVNPSYGLFND